MSIQDRFPNFVEDQRDFFDVLVTEDWDFYVNNDAWDFVRQWEVKRLLRHIRPRRILDIGCGCGFQDLVLANAPFVERVDAIDYSEKSIEKANQHYPHAKVHRSVASYDAFKPDEAYDLVVSFHVLEHLTDPDLYLRQATALTRPGGYVGIVTPNGQRLDVLYNRLRNRPVSMLDPQHFHEYTPREVADLAHRNGLLPKDVFGSGLHFGAVPFINKMPLRWKMRLSAHLPSISHCFGILFQRPE